MERGRAQREARKLRSGARARSRAAALVVGIFNVHALAFNSKNGIGHSAVIIEFFLELDCSVVGLHDTRRDGHSTFTTVGCTVFFSEEDGSKFKRKETHGGGLSVGESTASEVGKGGLVVECISARLMKVRIEFVGK